MEEECEFIMTRRAFCIRTIHIHYTHGDLLGFECRVYEPVKTTITGNFHPKMLLIDVSIEGPKKCEGQLSRFRDHNKVVKYGKKVESWHMESQPGGIRINKFLTQLDFFSVGIYIYSTDNKQSNSLILTKMMVHACRCSPL